MRSELYPECFATTVWSQLLAALKFADVPVATVLGEFIELCERQISSYLSQVFLDPTLQRLEASWRGLENACSQLSARTDSLSALAMVRMFVLDLSISELNQDLDGDRDEELKGSAIYQKLYVKTYDQLIGDLPQFRGIPGDFPEQAPRCYPLSLLILDFPVWVDDESLRGIEENNLRFNLNRLRRLCRIAERGFFMILGALSPGCLVGEAGEHEGFARLGRVFEPKQLLTGENFQTWSSFRAADYARWVGLTIPRVLLRQSWHGSWLDEQGFRYRNSEEQRHGLASQLWGSSAFAYLQVLIRAQLRDGWFAEAMGIERESRAIDGNTTDLSQPPLGRIDGVRGGAFEIGAGEFHGFPGVDYAFSEADEALFSSKGLLPLFACARSQYLAVLDGPSASEVKQPRWSVGASRASSYESQRLSAQFPNMLCVCKLAHAIKIKLTRMLGSLKSQSDLEREVRECTYRYACKKSLPAETRRGAPFDSDFTRFMAQEDEANPGVFAAYLAVCLHPKYLGTKFELQMTPLCLELGEMAQPQEEGK